MLSARPAFSWSHPCGVVISCGVNWLTIANRSDLLLRLQEPNDLSRFRRVLERGIKYKDGMVDDATTNPLDGVCANKIVAFERSRVHISHERRKTYLHVGGEKLDLFLMSLYELRLWLGYVAGEPEAVSELAGELGTVVVKEGAVQLSFDKAFVIKPISDRAVVARIIKVIRQAAASTAEINDVIELTPLTKLQFCSAEPGAYSAFYHRVTHAITVQKKELTKPALVLLAAQLQLALDGLSVAP